MEHRISWDNMQKILKNMSLEELFTLQRQLGIAIEKKIQEMKL